MTQKEIIGRVQKGGVLKVDLPGLTYTLDGTTHPASSIEREPATAQDALERLESLYAIYKRSVPTERSDRRRRNYFKALPECELTEEDLLYGTGRDEAQAELELHVLACISDGTLTWDHPGRWFWKSPRDPDLVLLRDWFPN